MLVLPEDGGMLPRIGGGGTLRVEGGGAWLRDGGSGAGGGPDGGGMVGKKARRAIATSVPGTGGPDQSAAGPPRGPPRQGSPRRAMAPPSTPSSVSVAHE